jgi:hypothetical protein
MSARIADLEMVDAFTTGATVHGYQKRQTEDLSCVTNIKKEQTPEFLSGPMQLIWVAKADPTSSAK